MPTPTIVTIKNNIVVCNSRDVADYFKKAHRTVLRDIDTLMHKIVQQELFTEISVEGRTGFGVRHYRAFDIEQTIGWNRGPCPSLEETNQLPPAYG